LELSPRTEKVHGQDRAPEKPDPRPVQVDRGADVGGLRRGGREARSDRRGVGYPGDETALELRVRRACFHPAAGWINTGSGKDAFPGPRRGIRPVARRFRPRVFGGR